MVGKLKLELHTLVFALFLVFSFSVLVFLLYWNGVYYIYALGLVIE